MVTPDQNVVVPPVSYHVFCIHCEAAPVRSAMRLLWKSAALDVPKLHPCTISVQVSYTQYHMGLVTVTVDKICAISMCSHAVGPRSTFSFKYTADRQLLTISSSQMKCSSKGVSEFLVVL